MIPQARRKSRGIDRALSRRGTDPKKAKPAERRSGRLTEPAVCDRCGAVCSRRVWRRGRKLTHALLSKATWTECPACLQTDRGEYWGRIVLHGDFVGANEDTIRQRIQNV